MTNEAKGLLAEADRLLKEASGMDGSLAASAPKKTRAKKETVAPVVEAAPVKTTRRKKAAVES
jgi:hypothetical protein